MFYESNDIQLSKYFQPLIDIDYEINYSLIADSLKYSDFHDEVSEEIIEKMQKLDINSDKYLFLNCDLINRLKSNKIKYIKNIINNNLDVYYFYKKIQEYEYNRDLKYSVRNEFIKTFCTQLNQLDSRNSNLTDSIDCLEIVSNDDFDFFNN